jgi:hypothetical protein
MGEGLDEEFIPLIKRHRRNLRIATNGKEGYGFSGADRIAASSAGA